PTTESWYDMKDSIFYTDIENKVAHPYYEFFQERLALTEYEDILGDNYFWKNIKAHPNYDEYHKQRNWIDHMDAEMTTQVMVVGGWNDEQNLYGILNSYKSISKKNPGAQFVIGPWSHGHNKRRDSLYYLGDIYYGEDISKIFQETIEFEYFEYHLKDRGSAPDFKIKMYDMGLKAWDDLDEFPLTAGKTKTMYLNVDGTLTEEQEHQLGYSEYVSDPFNPVPYLESNEFARMAPKSYMTADQRFLSDRKDVLTFTSEVLTEDLTMLGTIEAIINFSTELEDADIYVKLMDVYPDDRAPEENDAEGINFQGYQQMVRQGYIRGRFRDSFSEPKPFVPNEKTEVKVPLLEVYYTFKKDHKIMIQVQSSMFPLFGVNPQNYVENVYEATKADFKASKHQVFNDSKLIFPIK
ncbi:MAG: putative CocE/NonD family hydrolase, partial [Arenicella sp.]